MFLYPTPAPQSASANPAAFASLSTRATTPYALFTSAASGKLRQQGKLGGLITIPVLGSRGPGEQIPIPSRPSRELGQAASTASIALLTAVNPAAASPAATIGARVLNKTFPSKSTKPAAT